MTIRPVSKICGAKVLDRDGQAIGAIVDLMLDDGQGAIAYVVMSYGGMLGIGEKLFAVPWPTLSPVDENFTIEVSRERLDTAPGLDKDAWPTGPDPLFS